jgi:hypothetical protein
LAEAQTPPNGPVGGVHHFEAILLGLSQQDYVGLVDVPTYQQWTAQVPPELRALFDQVIWSVAKEGGIDP